MKKLIFTLALLMTISQIDAQDSRSPEDAKGLEVGVKAPDFKAIDASGKKFNLKKELKNGPVVMIFYRGHWCPYCNQHLAEIQDSLQLIMDKGAKVVAVSPENPEYLEKMADKTGAKFTLLYDEGYGIAEAYDVNFTPKKMKVVFYNTAKNAQMKKAHSDEAKQLPIPATYIIDKDGNIAWRHFDPDYKQRSTVKEIIANLPAQ